MPPSSRPVGLVSLSHVAPLLPTKVFPASLLSQGAVACGVLAACGCRGHIPKLGRNVEGAGLLVWSKVTDSGCGAYLCGIFEAVQVLLWGLEALSWRQTGPRCASLNLEVLRTLEVASECLASCVHLPRAPRWPLVGPPAERARGVGPSLAPWSFAWRQRQVAPFGDAAVQGGGPLVRERFGEGCWQHHFG